MSKPQSIKIDPWVGFPRQPYSIIDDDFCHEKAFVAKINAKNDKATVNIKETLNSKKGVWSVADQVKLWFDLPHKHSLYAKVKSTDYIKIHYDFGICERNNKKWNTYASINSNKLLKNIILKAGVQSLGDKCQSDNRIRVSLQDNSTDYQWYHRTVIKKDKYKFGLLGVFDIGKSVLQKNNLLFTYTHNDQHSVYLRAENDGYRRANPKMNDPTSIFDNIIVDYVNNIDSKSKAAVEASYSLKQKNLSSAQLVYQRQENKTTFKVGVNNKLDVKAFMKKPLYKFENLATLTTGLGVSGIMKNQIGVKYGFQMDINL